MATALEELLALLDVERLEVNLFRGVSPEEHRQRVFGGQVASQALIAAGRTVDADRRVHSLHAYFLRPGDTEVPIVYEVDRIRDGQSFTTRRVVGIQHGRAIFNLAASFHVDEAGPEHGDTLTAAPDPETLPRWSELLPQLGPLEPRVDLWLARHRALDVRAAFEPSYVASGPREPMQDVWVRTDGALPDDPLLHACIAAYTSDLVLLDTAVLPHVASARGTDWQLASLDHAMWFHRPFRADDWLLYRSHSPSAAGAVGFTQGAVFQRDGTLAMSLAQEGLVRPFRA